MPRKTSVVGIEVHCADKAYPEDLIWRLEVIEDRIYSHTTAAMQEQAVSALDALHEKIDSQPRRGGSHGKRQRFI